MSGTWSVVVGIPEGDVIIPKICPETPITHSDDDPLKHIEIKLFRPPSPTVMTIH